MIESKNNGNYFTCVVDAISNQTNENYLKYIKIKKKMKFYINKNVIKTIS